MEIRDPDRDERLTTVDLRLTRAEATELCNGLGRSRTNKPGSVPVDVANFTQGQAQRVADFVGSLDNPGVFVVGGQS